MSYTVSPPSNVPPEHALLAVDMQGYSQIPEVRMAPVRSDLDLVLTTVLAQSGLEPPHPADPAFKDTGDGAIFVLPAGDVARLVDPLLGHLHSALARYDRERLAASPPLRLRVAVHVGPLSLPDHRGAAINEVCRLLDSTPLRTALSAARDHDGFLAAAVSDPAFRRTVRAGRTSELEVNHFLSTIAHVEGKPDFAEPCHLYVPRLVPQLLAPYISAVSSLATAQDAEPGTTPKPGSAQPPAPAAAPARPPHGPAPVFQFNGAMQDTTVAQEIQVLRIDRRGR
ncbi:hypothetical protein ACFVYE_04985 [Streptomyces sp. NPDC058239]|uniref:hypothetical protein n=1 Tax=Streptomyces sp. NPDC058239 TaxID=3346395 RepID=UPI0036E55B87